MNLSSGLSYSERKLIHVIVIDNFIKGRGGIFIFKIGEFSKLTQVSIRMLRYYDETGLLKPARIDKFTGYRFYSVEQIAHLHKIIFLRDSGFSVSEIAVTLNCWEDAFLTDQLKDKYLEIERAITREQERLKKIETALHDLTERKTWVHYDVSLKSIPSLQVLSLRKIIPDYFSEELLWKELTRFIEEEGLNISQNSSSFAIYHDDEYKEANVDVEVCVVVNQSGISKDGFTFRQTEKVDTMAYTWVYGPFENIASGYLSFAHWLQQHNQYRMKGGNRQICHRGPWNEENPDRYLTEIQIPVESQFNTGD
ncbi:DNA-binding transcriptional MerR regulator [Fontibacillus solani]|uniref:DNA-binding transcriptional MerR regulator n=1 Tax=Fontibacillus solani TaxID=1572857 RepID=A0A7W3XTX1_9BACL|nr:MerR family transcriptional regulator [Fontibacillus solani]MBA9088083.1 DNA-binding transcriptional MerR regulator [Fontibacillus solani]